MELMVSEFCASVKAPTEFPNRGDEAGPEMVEKVTEVLVIENEPLVPGPKTMIESIKFAKLAPVRSSISAMSARLITNLRAMVALQVQIVFAFLVPISSLIWYASLYDREQIDVCLLKGQAGERRDTN
jgi:hypothetical protein